MMSHRLMTLFVCLAAAATPVAAQERLTLADATARALERNHSIRIEREGLRAADARDLAAQGDYDLQFRLDAGSSWRRLPVTSLFSGAPDGDLAPTDTSVGTTASISQLFKNGAVADTKVGALSKSQLTAFLDRNLQAA